MTEKVHVVIGGGTSAVILIVRLIEKGEKVILIDPVDDIVDNTNGHQPTQWSFEATTSNIHNFITAEQKAIEYRQVTYPHCNSIGGNNNINAMLHNLGHMQVYDSFWPSSWNSQLIKLEEKSLDPILTTYPVSTSGILKRVLEVAKAETRYPESFVYENIPILAKNNIRWRLSSLIPTLVSSGALTIIKGCVELVVIEKGIAVAVKYRARDSNNDSTDTTDTTDSKSIQTVKPSHGGEIIICSGAFGSPRILYDSILFADAGSQQAFIQGTGQPKTILSEGLTLPLADHITIPFFLLGNWNRDWNVMEADEKTPRYPINSVHGWIFLDENGEIHNPQSNTPPRCQIVITDGHIVPDLIDFMIPNLKNPIYQFFRMLLLPLLKSFAKTTFFRWICSFAFFFHVCIVQPKSKGTVLLKTNGSSVSTPVINSGFLTDESDLKAAYKCFLRAKTFLTTGKQQTNLRYTELLPGPLFAYGLNYEMFCTYARWFAATYYHPCGTCPMETATAPGIVDDQLRVKGIANLRIADASIMPAIPSFPTAKLCMLIGQQASRFLTSSKVNT